MTAADVARSREAQGLPPTITDPAALARIAAILLDAEPEVPAEDGGPS